MADNQTLDLIPAAPEHIPETDTSAPGTRAVGRPKRPDPLHRLVARRRAAAILALTLEGRRPKEIAQELNVPVKTVYWALYQLRKGNHTDAKRDVVEAIDLKIKPLVVERLEERLEDPNVDQDLLIEAAKGVGVFKTHQKQEGGGVQQQALVVKFEMPEGTHAPVTAIGEIHMGKDA